MPFKVNIAIFVLEDNPHFKEVVKDILEENKFLNVKVFQNEEEFLSAIEKNFHIFIIDYWLKNRTSVDVIRDIHNKQVSCFIIAMSAYDDAAMYRNLINVGINKFISKTERDFPDQLVKCVNEGINYINDSLKFFNEVRERFNQTSEEILKLRNKL
jgi:DNA-binding NarL/FixJ family response regulator